MIPNKTEEQILYSFFKFYDLDGSQNCNLQNFIKANDKLGVSLSKITDIEKIFNYFDKEKRGLINYKNFCHDIFNLKNRDQNPNNVPLSSNDFPTLLNKYLIKKGGNLSLINLIKNLKIVDYNNANKMTIDDFLNVLNESNLKLTSNEIQSIFQDYQLFSNGLVYYNKILDDLFDKFFTRKREILAENIYYNLTNNEKNNISLNDIRNLYMNTPNDDPRKDLFMKFINNYKYVTKASIDKPMNLNDMKKFIKYIGYGIESDEQLRELLFELDNPNENYNNEREFNNDDNQFKSSNKPNKFYNNDKYNNSNQDKINNIINKLRNSLIRYGRKTLFNFIKQFKHYDNNTRTNSKYDFTKVFQEFNINVSNSDINELFKEYGSNENNIIYYLKFLKDISNFSLNKKREDEIRKVCQFIYNKSNEFYKPINIDFIKEIYCAENNYFISDEGENKIDFFDCLELFHYAFKGVKNDNLYEEEIIEFYHFISFLIENDNNFISLLRNEWRERDYNNENDNNTRNNFNFTFGQKGNENPQNSNLRSKNRQFNNQNNNNYNNNNYNNNYNNKYNEDNYSVQNEARTNYQRPGSRSGYNNNNALEKFKEKLKSRGIRGLLYLHRQFILSCPNTNKITLNDLKNIFQSQHISLNDFEYNEIFNKFKKDKYLDFPLFIREFKKELNDTKLNYVEDAFSKLDINENERIPIEYIKKKYDAKNHPEVISGKKNQEENLLEFIDCFGINFDLLNPNINDNFVDFEIFANCYEYVAFVYDNDKIFGKILKSTFH